MPFEHYSARNFTAPSIRAYAPAASGVYGISNATEWLYIGETDDLQRSLLEYLSEEDRSPRKAHPTGFVFEVCGAAQRPARQGRLVQEYRPTGNRTSLRPR